MEAFRAADVHGPAGHGAYCADGVDEKEARGGQASGGDEQDEVTATDTFEGGLLFGRHDDRGGR
jgi:hypothetical protein